MDLFYSAAAAFAIGTLFGSFMNVCLTRWPAGESVVRPRSHCRNCGHVLGWSENIPLLSWLALRGRCGKCGAQIGWRYPLVELLCGIAFAAAVFAGHTGPSAPLLPAPPLPSLPMLAACVFSWLALALAFFDAESYWLPDLLTLPGIALGFFFRCAGDLALLPERAEVAALHAAFTLLEIVAAALLILLIRWLYFLVRHHEGMGLGDAKLMAMLAAWLGWQRMLLAFVLGIFLAATFAAAQLLPGISKQRVHDGKLDWARKMLPFGTFLCCGGLMSFFFGGRLIALYLALSGF